MRKPDWLNICPEVAAALAAGGPVVALESTVIAHGLPHPRNLDTAGKMAAAIRAAGAVPATVGVIDGRVSLGLTGAEIERLGTATDILKASRRDLGLAAAAGRLAATTVAATAFVAAAAGVEAFNHFSTGLSLLDPLSEGKEKFELELTLRIGFGSAALAIEGHSADDIERNYSRILELAEILENPRERFRAHLGLGAFCYVGGDMEKGREHCEICLNLAQSSGDREELLHAHRIMCELCFYIGEFRNSCDHYDKCISLYRKSEHIRLARELGDDPVVIASMYKALSLWFLGFPDKAIAVCRESLSLAYELKHAFTIAQAEFYTAWLYAYLRDYETAEQHAARAIKNCEMHTFSMYLGLSRVIYGWAQTMRGGYKQGETDIKEGLNLIRGPNADVCESCFLLFFAEHSLFLGEFKRGLSIIKEARDIASERFSERFAEPERTRIEAELRAGENQEVAEQGLLKAMDLARKQESLSLELRVALSLCRLLRETNRDGEGMRILNDVFERFTEGFKTSDLRAARSELKLGG